MIDSNAISGMLSGLTAAAELAQLAISVRDVGIIRAKAIELQREIIAAQSSALTAQADQFALTERVRQLEKEVADLKAWDAKKKNYKLTKLGQYSDVSGFAYTLREQDDTAGPLHYLCANCFEGGRKSILHSEKRVNPMADVMTCHHCGADIYLHGHAPSTAPKKPR
jgi:hypothetical protein